MRYWVFFFSIAVACTGQSPHPETVLPESIVEPIADTLAVDSVKIIPILDFDTLQWAELILLDSSMVMDLKYATADNFVQEQLYDCPRCFLRPEVAEALVGIHRQLKAKGWGLKLLDCYRPRPIQQKLWDKVPNPSYVTPPAKGSMHNRGRAVDLTLTDALGREVDMGTSFDYFGPKAHHTYTELPDSILDRRILLKTMMEQNGFRSIRTEWWHYYFAKGGYPLADWQWECDRNKGE